MSSIDTLLQTSPSELVADLKALRDERAIIERKEAMLEQALDVIAQQGGEKVAQEIAALGVTAGVGSLRDQILQVLAVKREEGGSMNVALVPREVLKVLSNRGNHGISLDNVRVTMKRMVDSRELERPIPDENVVYALPGTAEAFPGETAELAMLLKQGPQK